MKKLYTLILVTFLSFTINAQTWTMLTSGTTTTLLSLATVSVDTTYVVGTSGLIRKTVDGGTTWAPQTSGTGNSLYSVAFVSNQKGFTVGDGGTVLKTIDGGTTWTSVPLTTATLRFVYFYNSMLGFITGGGGLILRTADGGATWAPATTGTSQQINAIYFSSSTVGYATAFGGEIIKSTDGGINWLPLTSGTTTPLGVIHFTSATDGVLIGDGGLIKRSTNSGVSWPTVSSGTTDVLTGMDFMDANIGFIVGGNIGANIGCILTTLDGGATWTYALPGSNRLTRVTMFSPTLGYAVGLNGNILKFSATASIVDNLLNDGISIYPNPFNNSATISFDTEQQNITVKTIDVLGKELRSQQFTGKQLLIEKNELKAGIYFVQLISENKVVATKKIVVE